MKHLLKATVVTVYVAAMTAHVHAQSAAPDRVPEKQTVVSIVGQIRPGLQRPAEDVDQAHDQPLMATGLDLTGKPQRFPAHQTPGHSGMVAY